ncbi:MAG: hypothetical protein QNJ07_14745 [Woeseiaceae bacterium]|nr:hypothetical protein [Woeseiaceae bacterium]
MLDKDFIRDVEQSCESALIDVGFKRPRKGTRYLEITEDFLGWVGINHGRHPDYLRINPFVGIHCVPLMRLCDDLEGEKYRKGAIATVSVHLGEICPHVDQFIFCPSEPIEPEARRLSTIIYEHGVPWMTRHASYEAILPILQSKAPTLGGYPERVAATHYLMGNEKKAQDFVAEQRAIFETEHKEYSPFFERFAGPFMKLMAA